MPEQPYEAACMGGPLHGQIQLSRFPAGFVLVDKPRHMAWVYRWDGSVWRVDPGGMPATTAGTPRSAPARGAW